MIKKKCGAVIGYKSL